MKNQLTRRNNWTLALVLFSAGCATPDAAAPPAPEAAPTQSAASAEFDPLLANEIMNQPLDGTSVEAFEAGLAEVQAVISPPDYRRLLTALQWLEFYDIPSRGDPEQLYRTLDGMTPRQIITRAQWRGK